MVKNYCNLMENTEEGFADFTFDITKIKKKAFGGMYLECAAQEGGETVGFALIIKRDMRGIVNNDVYSFVSYPDGFKMKALPRLSKKFFACMKKHYGVEIESAKMKKSFYIECGALSGDPQKIRSEEVDFKCFLHSEDTEKYAEFYINIDLPVKKLYLREKDPEYRENIIKYFCR